MRIKTRGIFEKNAMQVVSLVYVWRSVGKHTVLLVEDNDDTRQLMRFLIEMRGYRVIEAENGLRGVEQALKEIPDLILMDLSMPVMDGFEATKQIRSEVKTSDIPIVVMSAHCWQLDRREQALLAGAADCIDKPVDIPVVEDILKRYLPS